MRTLRVSIVAMIAILGLNSGCSQKRCGCCGDSRDDGCKAGQKTESHSETIEHRTETTHDAR